MSISQNTDVLLHDSSRHPMSVNRLLRGSISRKTHNSFCGESGGSNVHPMRLYIMQFRVAAHQIAQLYRIQPQKTQAPENNILRDQSTMPLPPFAPSHILSRISTIHPCLSCKWRRFCSTRLYTLAEKFELLGVVRWPRNALHEDANLSQSKPFQPTSRLRPRFWDFRQNPHTFSRSM